MSEPTEDERRAIDYLKAHPREALRQVGQKIEDVIKSDSRPKKRGGAVWWRAMILVASDTSDRERHGDSMASLLAEAMDSRRAEAPRCYATGKVIFASESEARQSRSKRTKSDRLRTYVCEHCHGFHLTSQVR